MMPLVRTEPLRASSRRPRMNNLMQGAFNGSSRHAEVNERRAVANPAIQSCPRRNTLSMPQTDLLSMYLVTHSAKQPPDAVQQRKCREAQKNICRRPRQIGKMRTQTKLLNQCHLGRDRHLQEGELPLGVTVSRQRDGQTHQNDCAVDRTKDKTGTTHGFNLLGWASDRRSEAGLNHRFEPMSKQRRTRIGRLHGSLHARHRASQYPLHTRAPYFGHQHRQ